MARLTVSLPEKLAKAADSRARAQRRSTSAYVALLIEADVSEIEGERRLLDEAKRLGVDTRQVLTAAVRSASPRPPAVDDPCHSSIGATAGTST